MNRYNNRQPVLYIGRRDIIAEENSRAIDRYLEEEHRKIMEAEAREKIIEDGTKMEGDQQIELGLELNDKFKEEK